MSGKCVRSSNTGGDKCSICGFLPSEVHKAGPLLGKRLFCPSCCVGCACKPRPTVPVLRGNPSQPPTGDPWYRDERRRESEASNWVPARKWF
jgi:hypothetical protein